MGMCVEVGRWRIGRYNGASQTKGIVNTRSCRAAAILPGPDQRQGISGCGESGLCQWVSFAFGLPCQVPLLVDNSAFARNSVVRRSVFRDRKEHCDRKCVSVPDRLIRTGSLDLSMKYVSLTHRFSICRKRPVTWWLVKLLISREP